MELRQLRYFLILAEELHFGRAAKRLNISQPPLSQQIMALEDELGVKLFARTSRQVRLSKAGEELRREAGSILEKLKLAAKRAQAAARGEAGPLRLGYVNPAMDAFLGQTIAKFCKLYPQVELGLQALSTQEQLQALNQGRIELGFIRYAGQALPGLRHAIVHREPYLAALPAGHALAGKKDLKLADFSGVDLILPPRDSLPGLWLAMRRAFAAAGAEPELRLEAVSKFSTLSLVAAGLGAAFVPASARSWRPKGVVFRKLAPGLPEIELASLWPQDGLCPAGQRLLEILNP